jgi:hypothetical protein
MQKSSNEENNSSDNKDTILRLAGQEGKIFKAGASGKYKKNLITRIGFILIGLPFFTFFGIGYLTVKDLMSASNFGEVLTSILLAVVFFVFGLIGVALIRHALKK